jgi:hypothetical protein
MKTRGIGMEQKEVECESIQLVEAVPKVQTPGDENYVMNST